MTDNYLVEYMLIPNFIKWIDEGKLSQRVLLATDRWKEFLKDDQAAHFDWNALKASARRLDDRYEMIVYLFPEPVDVPEAVMGVVIHDVAAQKYHYYTMEKSYHGCMIGSKTTEGHFNYGGVSDPTSFLKWVVSRYVPDCPEPVSPEPEKPAIPSSRPGLLKRLFAAIKGVFVKSR